LAKSGVVRRVTLSDFDSDLGKIQPTRSILIEEKYEVGKRFRRMKFIDVDGNYLSTPWIELV
jgi:hypothetical protein